MSTDPTDLLARATPERVPDVDYHGLARAGRRRRLLRRGGAAVVAVGVVAAGAVTAIELRQPTGFEVMGTAPDQQPAADPVGAWSEVASLDTGRNDAFVEATGSGQLVVYGGTKGLDGQSTRDGRVIDVSDGSSRSIPAPPIDARPFPAVALADDRLVVFGGNDGSADGAYYDLADQTWTSVPALSSDDIAPNLRYWDGTTMIVGDSHRMSEGTIGNPAFWQWQVGQDSWTRVTESPVDAGSILTSVSDGRLAVWSDPVVDGPDGIDRPDIAADVAEGQTRLAVYDVAAGTWTPVARGDLPALPEGGRAHIGWVDDELVAVPLPPMNPYRSGPDDRGTAVELATPVAYTGDALEPRELAPLPDELHRDTLEVHVGDGSPAVSTTSAPITASVGRISAALTDDGTWTEPVTASRIQRVGSDLVAVDTPWVRDTPLAAAVWDDGWQPAADPGQLARGFAGIASTDEDIYLVGGSTLRTPAPGEEPDGNPTEEGSNGPYVIDTHLDVIGFSPGR